MQNDLDWGLIETDHTDVQTTAGTPRHVVIEWDDFFLEKPVEQPKSPVKVHKKPAVKKVVKPVVKPQLTKAETRAAEIQSDMEAAVDTFL